MQASARCAIYLDEVHPLGAELSLYAADGAGLRRAAGAGRALARHRRRSARTSPIAAR